MHAYKCPCKGHMGKNVMKMKTSLSKETGGGGGAEPQTLGRRRMATEIQSQIQSQEG